MIVLPWPDMRLSPNARTDRRFITGVRAKARKDGFIAAQEAGAHKIKSKSASALRIIFHGPDSRRRDLDNLLSACKPMIDGMADAMKRDDSEFGPLIHPRPCRCLACWRHSHTGCRTDRSGSGRVPDAQGNAGAEHPGRNVPAQIGVFHQRPAYSRGIPAELDTRSATRRVRQPRKRLAPDRRVNTTTAEKPLWQPLTGLSGCAWRYSA